MPNAILSRLERAGALTLGDANLKPFEAEGHGTLPVLELPAEALAFDDKTGFWVSLATLLGAGDAPLLVGQIHAFDLAEGAGGWAIPMAYEPESEKQAIMQMLGFDEGWELSTGGPFFLVPLTQHSRSVLTLARDQGRLVLTTTGASSLFPMTLAPTPAKALATFLAVASP